MTGVNIGKAPSNSAVLPFYATGALAFVVLCAVMLRSAEVFTGHYFNGNLLTIVHLAALGWGTMIIFGAAHQLLPVICERELYSEKMATTVWYTLTAGIVLLTATFWKMNTGGLMIAGGALIVLSVLLYNINVMKTAKLDSGFSMQKLFTVSSAVWLLFTVTVGLLLAVNLAFPFFERNHFDILKFHAHAGFAGWFLQLITGMSTRLVPMFLLGKSQKEYLLKGAFALQNAGLLLFLLDGYFLGITTRVLLYAVIVLAGIILWLLYLYDAFRNRLRKRVELLMKHTFISFACLLIAVLLIPAVYSGAGGRATILYGMFILMGWITGIILGKTFKTLPFIIWNSHYKNLSGKVKVPLPKQLYSEKLTVWQFWFFISALLVLAAGIALQNLMVIRLGLFLYLMVALLYFTNVAKLLFHKTHIQQ